MVEYIKKDVRSAIKSATSIFIYQKEGYPVIILHPEKAQNWTNFIKEGIRTKEFNKLILYHKNGGRTEIEVRDHYAV